MNNSVVGKMQAFVQSRWFVPIALIVLTLTGAWFRLNGLGDITMKADEGNGWSVWLGTGGRLAPEWLE